MNSIEHFFEEATKKLDAMSVNDLEKSFLRAGYHPVRNEAYTVPSVDLVSKAGMVTIKIDSSTYSSSYEAANDEIELSFAA